MDEHAFGAAVFARDLVGTNPVHLAPVGEEQQVSVCRGVQHVLDDVILAQRCATDTSSAPPLGPVGAGEGCFDVARRRDGDDQFLIGDQIFKRHLPGVRDDAGPAGVTELVADLGELGADQHSPLLLAVEQALQLGDQRLQLLVLLAQLPCLERSEAPQWHVKDVGRLNLGEIEPPHQAVACGSHVPQKP